jgi:hypothetical protein
MGALADQMSDPHVLCLENLDTDLRPPASAVEVAKRSVDEDSADSYLPFLGRDVMRDAAAALVGRQSGHGLYRVTDGAVKQVGYGVARTDAADGRVVALDLSIATATSQQRVVVNDEGMFIGAHESGRDSWIDFSDPSGLIPPVQPTGVGHAVARGATPARRVSSAAET